MLTNEDLKSVKALIGESESRVIAFIESAVLPKINLLAEGQQTILQTLAPKNRVEELEQEVGFLKEMLSLLAKKVNELEKAV